jgi:predicted NodU family carbamoyl transferase
MGENMKTKTALMITLGHNSSAVYFDGEKAIGYEEERINRVKSSSAYPRLSLEELVRQVSIAPGSYVFVSHWFDKLDFDTETNKYFDKQHFDAFVEKYALKKVLLSEEFTHHDAHAWSVVSFFRDKLTTKQAGLVSAGDKLHVIAADGFGNSQEVFSVYELDANDSAAKPKLVERYHGYDYSLGLMYQYATSYCGMKENQDEYKFLGYETRVASVLSPGSLDRLHRFAKGKANLMFDAMTTRPDGRHKNWKTNSGLANFDVLFATKKSWNDHFEEVMTAVAPGVSGRDLRVVVGHYIQELIEEVLLKMIERHSVKHLALSGGIFYNVKLNNRALSKVPGLFCVVPLAGDQGCGIGMYEAFAGHFAWGDLKWGIRPSFENWRSNLTPAELAKYGEHIKYYSSSEKAVAIADTVAALEKNELVNVVKSRMEYGPRALCSTTTLSIPTTSNVEIINDINERDTVMPMAPVMLVDAQADFFDTNQAERVVGSDRFMILTYNYKSPDLRNYGGVSHKYPLAEVWSGRPQFVEPNDEFMTAVLKGVYSKSKALINTSFNAHGRPIVYAADSVLDSFKFEFDKAKELGHKLPLLYLCDFDG